ncbi:MAG: FAD-dependent oxidoreductase [Pirellulales bacterium]
MAAVRNQLYDVVVIGGTPAGIAAAVAAARAGRSVALVEYHAHVGGMAVAGLGKSDIENRDLIRGFFREFVQRVRSYYADRYGTDSENFGLCREGYYYEPSVAEKVFEAILAEQASIDVYRRFVLEQVEVVANRVKSARVSSRTTGEPCILRGRVFIDSTYEGDLYAMAGAAFRVGRESRAEFGEPHAGVVYFDPDENDFLPGSTGAADDRLPAYTYRLCLSSNPHNSYPLTGAPDNYDRQVYLPYLDDLAAGRLSGPRHFVEGRGYNTKHFDTVVRALSVTELPNRKADANINPRPLAFPFPEENIGYVEGDWTRREAICGRHRELTLGLLYFLQNDSAVPISHREIANGYHLPLDEFADNGHFPFQLYVREARRLKGCYTLTEQDVTWASQPDEPRRHADAVAVGEFPIDSFPVRKRQHADSRTLEGYLCMLDRVTRPYQIPYRVMIPETIDGLIVPVAASASHVAFSSIRMEPTWMALGHAAGVAAHLAIEHHFLPREVPADKLQKLLRETGQVLDPASYQSRGESGFDGASARPGQVPHLPTRPHFTKPHPKPHVQS